MTDNRYVWADKQCIERDRETERHSATRERGKKAETIERDTGKTIEIPVSCFPMSDAAVAAILESAPRDDECPVSK